MKNAKIFVVDQAKLKHSRFEPQSLKNSDHALGSRLNLKTYEAHYVQFKFGPAELYKRKARTSFMG